MMRKEVKVQDMSRIVLLCEYLPDMGRYRLQHQINVSGSVMTLDQYYKTEKECVDYMNQYTSQDAAFLSIHIKALLTQMNTKSRTS